MQLTGSGSWRFEERNPQLLHIALFVRDAAHLAVLQSADVPPLLASDMPDHAEVLSADERAVAATQWVTWWRQLVDHEVREVRLPRDRGGGQDARTRGRAKFERLQKVFDPPEFGSLGNMPALRSAVVRIYVDAVDWSNSPEQRSRDPEQGAIGWSLVRSVAESIASDQGVSLDVLDAALIVLDVEGPWSHIAGPGCALCSNVVPADLQAARTLLNDLFISGLK